jgi:hypothetical protein
MFSKNFKYTMRMRNRFGVQFIGGRRVHCVAAWRQMSMC